LAHLVVMQRPRHEQRIDDPPLRRLLEDHRAAHRDELHQAPAGRILFQTVTQLSISSTKIRELIAAGYSPRYLLPESVLQILETERLYRG
jgi:nicotinate-nucleotide adenylyltransferase